MHGIVQELITGRFKHAGASLKISCQLTGEEHACVVNLHSVTLGEGACTYIAHSGHYTQSD